jgi:phosphatidylserine/phosphatidylglycerophosphate/cardiolipin synthase-like enzyme
LQKIKSFAQKLRLGRVIKWLLLGYFCYFAVSLLVPPLLQRSGEGAAAPVLSGEAQERVCLVDDNEEALLWRLRMIDAAEQQIVMATFDFRGDNSGEIIMAALQQAADRGVEVKLLVDGISGSLRLAANPSFRALAASPGVEAKFYSPIDLLRPWTINYRMHDKYLIIDDTAYMLGGRNCFDLFLGSYTDGYNLDRDLVVYEQAAGADSSLAQLQDYFAEVWALSCCRSAPESSRPAAAQQALREKMAAVREQYAAAYQPMDWEEATIATDGIALLSNPNAPGNKSPVLWESLCALMQQGRDIRIQTPYIVCNRSMYEGLAAVTETASVQIMTNAVENGANPFGCTDYLNNQQKIRQTGVSVVEWMGGQSLHTKTVLIDDRLSVVGSFNIDMRSCYLDTELMLVVDCPELNRALREEFDRMAQQSRTVSADGEATLGENCVPPELPGWKKGVYLLLRVILLPIRYLL